MDFDHTIMHDRLELLMDVVENLAIDLKRLDDLLVRVL